MAGNTSHKIMVILSSVRDGRHGIKVGNAVMNKLKDLPIESELLGKFLIVFVLFSTLFKKNYTFFYIQWRKTAKLDLLFSFTSMHTCIRVRVEGGTKNF